MKPEVQAADNNELQERLAGSVWATGCNSWYRDPRTGRNTTLWPGFTFSFWWRLRQLRSEDYWLLA